MVGRGQRAAGGVRSDGDAEFFCAARSKCWPSDFTIARLDVDPVVDRWKRQELDETQAADDLLHVLTQ